jgi:cation transport regulator ChaB
MPYRVNSDLPPSVRNYLPEHAPMIGWAAVKRSYIKAGDIWIAR